MITLFHWTHFIGLSLYSIRHFLWHPKFDQRLEEIIKLAGGGGRGLNSNSEDAKLKKIENFFPPSEG